MLHISEATWSDQENRTLSQKPKIKDIWSNSQIKYGEQYESWFNDHFWGRENLTKNNTRLYYSLNNRIENDKAFYLKSNGWMFQKLNDVVDSKLIEDFVKDYTEFNHFCEQNDIKLYVLIVPTKESIYQEYIRTQYPDIEGQKEYLKNMQTIQDTIGNAFIFPYKEFQEAKKKDFLFFKESHHWTDWGAYIGYLKLMNSISHDFKDIPIQSLENYKKTTNRLIREDWDRSFGIGNTTRLLNIKPKYAKKKILKDDYVYYDPVIPIIPEIQDISGYKVKYYQNNDKTAKYKVFLSGFSQNENLLQFLPYSFKEVKYYRLNDVKDVKSENEQKFLARYKKELLDFKPNILILTIKHTNLFQPSLWEVN